MFNQQHHDITDLHSSTEDSILARISEPRDLDALSAAEMSVLAEEMRAFLVDKVTAAGGHLGSNLGVVELTIALHRVFDSPRDALIFDTGHQAYPHKMLTGRQSGFELLRSRAGLSGYPNREESPHDWVESSHASAALSYADGLAKAFELTHQRDRHVVAIVGDGALTGGMCWEALNNIAAGKKRSIIVVVNDNGRSYAPTVGGLADRLAALRMRPGYERLLGSIKKHLQDVPIAGEGLYAVLHATKEGMKDAIARQALFSDFSLKYLGPIDGHDEAAVETALRQAKDFGEPVMVHTVTRKGMGHAPAENDPADCMHACGPADRRTDKSMTPTKRPAWTDVFANELVAWGARKRDVVAVTAAMPGPTGLSAFAARYPDRIFDVGIAEQHAVTSAAGLALGGMHPVVAMYSTFLNRAFDQLLMDVALLKLPVTFVLDRAGVTGPDGASHNGVWDLSILGVVPGIRVAAPRDRPALIEQFGDALMTDGGPTALRFPKGAVGADIEAIERIDGLDVLYGQPSGADVLVVTVGPLAAAALSAAARLGKYGIDAAVVDPRWVLPVPDQLTKLACNVRLVVTIEESGLHGGFGSALAAHLQEAGVDTPVRNIGVPQRFLSHGTREEIHTSLGLNGDQLAARIMSWAGTATLVSARFHDTHPSA